MAVFQHVAEILPEGELGACTSRYCLRARGPQMVYKHVFRGTLSPDLN